MRTFTVNKISLFLTIVFTLFILSCNKEDKIKKETEDYTVYQANMRLPLGAGTNSVVFFTFQNNTEQSVKVISATSSLDAKVEIHNVLMKDNMMFMQQAEFVEVKAKSNIIFKSGSYHLMVMGIKDKLKAKDLVTFTLELDNKEKITFKASVECLNKINSKH